MWQFGLELNDRPTQIGASNLRKFNYSSPTSLPLVAGCGIFT